MPRSGGCLSDREGPDIADLPTPGKATYASGAPVKDLSADRRRATIAAFAKEFGRELHNLKLRPELTFQQLYNRLQFAEETPSFVADASRAAWEQDGPAGPRPWLRRRNRLPESEALIQTLPTGHTGEVNSCAISPDGTRALSASDDATLKVWDISSGECLATIPLLGALFTVAVAATARASGGPAGVVAVAAGDAIWPFIVELEGLATGPLVVTALQGPGGAVARCPVCLGEFQPAKAGLGRLAPCPSCGQTLKLNSFVARHVRPGLVAASPHAPPRQSLMKKRPVR